MENKGQASAEYLLLIVVIVIIMAGVTIPLVGSSVNSTMDVSRASDTKNAIQSMANAVNLVYANGPGARRTIDIYMPQDMNLIFDISTNTINQKLDGISDPSNPSDNKTIRANVDYSVTFTNPNPIKGWHQTQIEWPIQNKTSIQVVFLT